MKTPDGGVVSVRYVYTDDTWEVCRVKAGTNTIEIQRIGGPFASEEEAQAYRQQVMQSE